MANRSSLAFVVVLACMGLCCGKEKSFERQPVDTTGNPNNPTTPTPLNTWEFTQTGNTYQGITDTASYNSADSSIVLTVRGQNQANQGFLQLTILGVHPITAGTYEESSIEFAYTWTDVLAFRNYQGEAGPFTIVIDHIDSAGVQGRFFGTVLNAYGEHASITEGKFAAALKYSVQPGLGANLPPLAGDWFPLKNRWTYSDPTGLDTLAITSSGTSAIGANEYTIFKNDATLEQRFYRKEGSKYYEYVTYFKDAPLSEPVELMFLEDDLPAGSEWQSDAGHPIIRGFAVDARIKNTIVSKDYTASFHGRTYYNLIQVRTDLLIRADNGDYQFFGKPITTIYAKGIGVIAYQDEIFDKPRSILHFDVIP